MTETSQGMRKVPRKEQRQILRVSFVVKRLEYPALFGWLSSLPVGRLSDRVRERLEAVLARGAEGARLEAARIISIAEPARGEDAVDLPSAPAPEHAPTAARDNAAVLLEMGAMF